MTNLPYYTRHYLIAFLVLICVFTTGSGQDVSYYYATIRTPFFQVEDHTEYGFAVNNSAMDFSFGKQFDKTSVVIAFQPKFNNQKGLRLFDNTGLTYLSPAYASHGYSELLITNRQKNKRSQDVWLGGGIGYQSYKDKLRLFAQFDWGNHARLINAGFSARASIYDNGNGGALRLEPAITGKFKFGPMRLTNQLGYSILVTTERVPMALLFTMGLSYVR